MADDLCDEDAVLEAISRAAPATVGAAFYPGSFHYTLPICFVGDSRTLPFRNAVYTSEFTSRPYSLHAVHLGITRAIDFAPREGRIGERLLKALVAERAVVTPDEGMTWTAARWSGSVSGTVPLVLFCGPYEAHEIMIELGPDTEIAAWDGRSNQYNAPLNPTSRQLPAEFVRQNVGKMMEPFEAGIDALHQIGFERIFIHGMPPSQWGERFKRAYPHVSWFETAHPNAFPKVWLLFDEALEAIAARTSTQVVRGPVDAGGILRPEATWDDVHYTIAGARELARCVVSYVEGVVE